MAFWSFIHLANRRRKAGLFLALLVLSFIWIGWNSAIINKTQKNKTPNRLLIINKEVSYATLDSDNDGLPDWEEKLYGTDPNNPDTDGDNTPDGKEIKLGRNPLKPGPSDYFGPIHDTAEKTDFSGYAYFKNLAAGNNFTQTILNKIIQTQGLDAFLSKDKTQTASAELLRYANELKKTAPSFSEDAILDSEIIVNNDSGPNSIKKYFNAVAEIYKLYIYPNREDSLAIATHAVEDKNPESLKKLDPLIAGVGAATQEIKKIPAPRGVLLFHKKEIWYLQQTTAQLSLLRNMNVSDPFYVIILLSLRIDLKKQIGALHTQEIPLWLKNNSIAFSSQDQAQILYRAL